MAGLSPAVERTDLARRALLLLTLWLGFWLLGIGLVCGLLWIPFAQAHYRSSVDFSGIVAACAALTLAYALRPRSGQKPSDITGPPALQREQAPALFSFIERIGSELGATAPVEIHLVTGATAFIYAKRSWTGRVSQLTVGLGLPLFAWLSEEELGAVIAHEFGHFVGGDLSLSRWVYRTRASIGVTIHALDDSMFFLDAPFRTYGHWFLRWSSAVSRAQEYSADALSAERFGAATACAALTKIHLLDPFWSAYLNHDLGPAIDYDARVPILDGFRRFCAASPKRREVQEAIDKAEHRAADIYDTHPTLKERVTALGGNPSGGLPPLSNCLHLVGGEIGAETLWYRRFNTEKLQAVSWDDFGTEILQPRMDKKFSGTKMAPEQMPLEHLPAMAQELDAWWERLRPEGVSFLSAEARRRYVVQILEDWIVVSLCHRGFTPCVRPGQSLILARDGESIRPDMLLAAACEGKITVPELTKYSQAA